MEGLVVFTVIFPHSLISYLFFKARVYRTVDHRMSKAFKSSSLLLFQYVWWRSTFTLFLRIFTEAFFTHVLLCGRLINNYCKGNTKQSSTTYYTSAPNVTYRRPTKSTKYLSSTVTRFIHFWRFFSARGVVTPPLKSTPCKGRLAVPGRQLPLYGSGKY
jgi:hypothetical protein